MYKNQETIHNFESTGTVEVWNRPCRMDVLAAARAGVSSKIVSGLGDLVNVNILKLESVGISGAGKEWQIVRDLESGLANVDMSGW
jgi:hypothetical protein